ncbi:hypothetical protein [Saccharolobus islandicus]|uniref:Uncharacterized protein n=2 Tax=Saccharolobus islandicus TaxID=43080 RepID=C3MTT7_SACI4|nr:hypothetical protein [Sulfolobus islandicus]ACP36971.1 conserved hypothetical protein [Sulfolobus islandicus M.14.25]ACP54108.1 conserved hypothetical protein [Sulfolobus islandicus M.16.27]
MNIVVNVKQYLMVIAGVLVSLAIASLVVYVSHMFITYTIKKPNIVERQSGYAPQMYELTVNARPPNGSYINSYFIYSSLQSSLVINKDPVFHVYPSIIDLNSFNNSAIITIYYSAHDRVNIAVTQQIFNVSVINTTVINDEIVATQVKITFYNASPNTIYLIPIWNQYNVTYYVLIYYE